jgi:hypothetical protein
MEKIYVEENQKNNKRMHLSVSVGLSFVVAFVAMLSILFVSLGGTTFALGDVTTLPSDFTTETDEFYIDTGSSTFGAPIFTAHNVDTPIFCVESAIEYATEQKYIRNGEIVDEGFIYLLSKLSALDVKDSDISGAYDTTDNPYSKADVVKTWIQQTAIWAYLGRTSTGTEASKMAAEYKNSNVVTTLAAINSISLMYVPTNENLGTLSISGSTFYNKYGVSNIINTAISYKGSSTLLTVTATKASDKFTEQNDYMKSDKVNISINATGGIAEAQDKYSVTLGNAPAGTKVYGVKSNGTEEQLTSLTNISYATYKSLYVYVPTSAITETVNFSLSVKGNFEVYTGYYYIPDASAAGQRIITIDKVVKPKSSSVEFTITKSEDTGSNASKIMYIVGMIVLLSGLGILYVNIKNQKQYQ